MTNMSTPAMSVYSSRHARTLSPPHSSTTGSTIGPQMQRMNIVTRVAIEGNAKEADSVAIKMYLKLALPADSVTPGSAIPLFKEEDVKILDSEVHPLDGSSSPYNFSSSSSPLLHNAARVLNLPARSTHSYLTLFGQQPGSSHYSTSSSKHDSDPPRLDEKYTGHILVSGYQVSFVLPKEFPPKLRSNGRPEENDYDAPLPSKLRGRRGSITGDKNVMLFMAGISMIVPYLSKPPRAPWLLSIPTPRCLSNNLKLRIFPPKSTTSTSSSFQSLSSAEADSDSPSWDMTADPHVTRMSTSRRSTYRYQHFADDESSDSASPGFSEGVGIQGTFPSTERIRVRWAHPLRNVDDGVLDGRRRVGCTNVRGEMSCTVLGRGRERSGEKEGVVMRLVYNGSCQDVWFGGVATLLGMDLGLEAKNCEVSWAHGHEAQWNIAGGTGYTGHDISGANNTPRQRQTSFDMPRLSLSPDNATPLAGPSNGRLSRQSSASSTASLLRAPLPTQNVPDYSFESGPTTPSEAGMSSILSTTDGGSRGRSRASSMNDPDANIPDPSKTISLHLNINDLLPPNANDFTFTITGIILVVPSASGRQESTPSDGEDSPVDLAVSFPRFKVLAADNEKINMVVRNEMESLTDTLTVQASSDPKARRTELARGGKIKLGNDDGRAVLHSVPAAHALRPVSPFHRDSRHARERDESATPSRPYSPLHRLGSTPALRETLLTSLRPHRDGALMIPNVDVTVTPLLVARHVMPKSYAVRALLPAPADHKSEWLEFFLAQPANPSTQGQTEAPPRIDVVSASLEGVPVLFETSAAARPEKGIMSEHAFEQFSGKEWITWVRVHVSGLVGGLVEVVYVVEVSSQERKQGKKGEGKARQMPGLGIILPAFGIPVGKLQVDIECPSDLDIYSIQSSLDHQQRTVNGRRLYHYSLADYFYPLLHIELRPITTNSSWVQRLLSHLLRLATVLAVCSLLYFVHSANNEVMRLRNALDACQGFDGEARPPMVTVTATVLSHNTPAPATGSAFSPTSHTQHTHDQPTKDGITVIDITSPTAAPQEQPRRAGGASAYREYQALLPPEYLRRFHFEMPFTTQQAMDTVSRGLGVAWQILRKLYHYPLDPP